MVKQASTFIKVYLSRLFPACLLLFLIVACSAMMTKKSFYTPITADLKNQNYDSAIVKMQNARSEFSKKDRLVYFLDAGLAYHYARLYDSSNANLSSAETAAEDLFTKSISRAALSVLLNDNFLAYSGEDYEILYTNLIMALNYIAENDYEGAFVEIRRANNKLNLLEQKYRDAAAELQDGARKDTAAAQINYKAKEVRFNNDAFARWMSMHMYAAEGNHDDAQIDFEYLRRAFREQPHIYNFTLPDVKYEADRGAILSIVALTGLAPVKEELSLRLRTDKKLNLVQVLYDDPKRKNAEYGHLPMPINTDLYLKFSIPQITPRPTQIGKIEVYSGSDLVGRLQLLEDIGTVAKETFKAKKSLIYLRTVARAMFKAISTHKLKKDIDDGGLGGWLGKALIDVGTDLTENADLRCSRLLPGKIYVADFEVEPDIYDLTIKYYNRQGLVINAETIPRFEVYANDFNLIQSVLLN